MSAPVAVVILSALSILASLFIGPEVGLFLVLAAILVVVFDAPGRRDRRDARNRNQAHRR